MKIYNKLFFVIDSNNYKINKKDLFYGYKWIENEGFWLDVRHKDNKVHIYTSYLSPIIVIYRNENYWAISNSVYYLNKHLLKNNIKLTINDTFLEYESKKTTAFSYNYYNDILLYNELYINKNDEEIDIIDGELHLVKKEFTLFSKNIETNLNDLNNWYEKYQKYFKDKENLMLSLSGGLDSRLLWYLFVRHNNKAEIHSYNNKPNVQGNRDSKLAKQVIKYYTGTELNSIDLLPSRNFTTKDIMDKSPTSYKALPFLFGICYNPLKLNIADEKLTYHVLGTGSNITRKEFQDIDFINGNIRRNWISTFIARYYTLNQVYVIPFFDSIILELNTLYRDYLHVILYSLYAKDLLVNNIPFCTNEKFGEYKFQELRADLFNRFSNIIN